MTTRVAPEGGSLFIFVNGELQSTPRIEVSGRDAIEALWIQGPTIMKLIISDLDDAGGQIGLQTIQGNGPAYEAISIQPNSSGHCSENQLLFHHKSP